MISDAEGIISDDKREELNQVISQNPELEDERKRFGAVYFAPDVTSVYQKKGDLKRRKAIVLWPYISFAAAASVIAFVFLMNNNWSEIGHIKGSGFAENNKSDVPVVLTTDTPEKNNVVIDEKDPVKIYQAIIKNSIEPKRIAPKDKDDGHTPLRTNSSRPLQIAFEPLMPISEVPTPLPTVYVKDESTVVDGSPTIPMINPIEGITSFVSKKTNTEVAMGARKNSKGKKGGFFFKVGKFEISKNKH